MGIEAINPFELPLLNTVLLLSSGITVTWAHHSLIQGNRRGTLYGLVATVFLALVFTGLQAVEYKFSTFSISDGAFGSCFYFATGFHGLTNVALFIYLFITFLIKPTDPLDTTDPTDPTDPPLLLERFSESTYYSKDIMNSFFFIETHNKTDGKLTYKNAFLEWLVGFTDGEGNFNIKLTGLVENTFQNVQFTFQIGLHIDDIETLQYIKDNLLCGHISKSGNRVNYFVNDINSLINVIIPVFTNFSLNSSKFHHFMLFKKAVLSTKNKFHLSNQGKLDILKLKKEMQNMSGRWVPDSIKSIKITKYWLAGFIDAEGTFSTSRYVPRLRLENHVKELELYNKIKEFLALHNIQANVVLTMPRVYNIHSNATIVLEVNKIGHLISYLIPLMEQDKPILKTLKKDFLLWKELVKIYYNGYHTTTEGKRIFDFIKLHMNKYRLSTNSDLFIEKILCVGVTPSFQREIKDLIVKLYLTDSPYIIKEGVRYYRETNKLVSEAVNITAIDLENNISVYQSMSDCAKSLKISRKKIKECVTNGTSYKGYQFVLN